MIDFFYSFSHSEDWQMHIYKNNYYYYDICEHIKIMDPEGKISSCPRLR